MNNLSQVIQLMSIEQQNRFLHHQKQKNRRSDTHNIKLFRFFASQKTDHLLSEKIYGEENRTAFNMLKKRLFDSVIDFIAIEGFENDASDEMDLLKLLLASRILLKQQQYKIGFKLLKKTIKKSKELELYSIASEAYHTYIEYIHKEPSPTNEKIIPEAKEMLNRLHEAESQHINFSLVRKYLSDLGSIDKKNLSNSLEQLFNHKKTTHNLTYKSLFVLMEITNEYASLHQNFHTILPFMEKSYAHIKEKESLAHHHLYYHIQILYFMANLYFRNKQFKNSQTWLEKMDSLMFEDNSRFRQRFQPKYCLLESLNKHYQGNTAEAIVLVEQGLQIISQVDSPEQYNLKLALGMYYFHQNELKSAMLIFKQWKHTDSWYEKRLGYEWTMKKNLFEIILHTEMENTEYALSRVKSFKRRYRSVLKNLEVKNAFVFLKLIEKHIQYPENTRNPQFKAFVESSIVWKDTRQEDIFVMSFYSWLKSKMTGRPIQEVLSDLI